MLAFLFLFFPFLSYCNEITLVTTLEPIKQALETVNENDLVIFDVDHTLIIPEDMLLRPCGEQFFLKRVTHFASSMPMEQINTLGSKMLLDRAISHVDIETPLIIRSLQMRSIKVIALTAMITGRFGLIPSMEDWRINELKLMGFDFSPAFPKYNHIVFGDIMRDGSLPIFKEGILCSAKHTKGEVLQSFLRRVKWKPARVFFIDDNLQFLESVQTSLSHEDIEFHGFHYRAIDLFNDKLDEDIALHQLTHLKEKEEWLSDMQVLEYLKER